MNFVINHAPGAGWIALPVDQQQSSEKYERRKVKTYFTYELIFLISERNVKIK